jgi:hypothetical protein
MQSPARTGVKLKSVDDCVSYLCGMFMHIYVVRSSDGHSERSEPAETIGGEEAEDGRTIRTRGGVRSGIAAYDNSRMSAQIPDFITVCRISMCTVTDTIGETVHRPLESLCSSSQLSAMCGQLTSGSLAGRDVYVSLADCAHPDSAPRLLW